jgi:hypothetical protein
MEFKSLIVFLVDIIYIYLISVSKYLLQIKLFCKNEKPNKNYVKTKFRSLNFYRHKKHM